MKKKNQVKKVSETKKLKKLRIYRDTLQTLTSSDNQKVVGGGDSDEIVCCSSPPRTGCATT